MVAILFEAVFTPLFIVLGILAVRRMKAKQAERQQAYRESPESRLLKLNE